MGSGLNIARKAETRKKAIAERNGIDLRLISAIQEIERRDGWSRRSLKPYLTSLN